MISIQTIPRPRKLLNLSQEQFARLVGTSTRTVNRWESGEAKPDPHTTALLRNMQRVVEAIGQSSSPAAIVRWLQTPDSDLGGHPPIDLLASDYATDTLFALIDNWKRGLV